MYIDNFENYLVSEQKSPCTIKAYKTAIQQMVDYVGKDEKEIGFDDFINWKNYMMKNYALNSVSQKVMAIRSYFKYLKSANIISVNPTKELKGAKIKHPEMKVLTEEQVKSMIQCAKGRDKAIITTLYGTGIRVSELINLHIDDVNKTQIKIVGKGDKSRSIYFNEAVKSAINEYIKKRKDGTDCLFVSNQGSKMTEQNISNMLKKIAEKTGMFDDVSWVTPHTFRRSAATRWAKHNVPITAIQKSLGHGNIQTTMLYIKTDDNSVAQTMNTWC